MNSQARMPQFPADITRLARGKAQRAVLNYLHRLPSGSRAVLSDMAAHPSFRGMHFSGIMSATEALAKRGIVDTRADDFHGETLAIVPHTHG